MKRMLGLSFLFHVGVFVLVTVVSAGWAPTRVGQKIYNVDLVNLPRKAVTRPATQKAPPAKPSVVKKPIKKAEPPPKVIAKKRPVKPAPKPIEPVAAVPAPATVEKEVPHEQPEPRPSEDVAAIPSVDAKLEAGIDKPDFEYPYYLDLIQRKIEMHWSPPRLNPAIEMKETVVVFVLFQTGRIDQIKIEKRSGNAFFDQAALRSVYQANPLPPLPAGIREDFLKIHFSFSIIEKG